MLWKEFYKNGLHYFKKVFMIISNIDKTECECFWNCAPNSANVMFRFWKNDFSKITIIKYSAKFQKL